MSEAKKPATKARRAKVATRVIEKLKQGTTHRAATTTAVPERPLEAIEFADQDARIQRAEDTRKRNTSAQNWPDHRKKRRRGVECEQQQQDEDSDIQAFFELIDDTFLRIRGSCGELSKAARMIRKRYEPNHQYFAALKNFNGVCEPIIDAITQPDNDGISFIWMCSRCNLSLSKNETPKFCRASGFRIAPIPRELAVLNRMEARLIGLGVSFTTCMNLYQDQQEFTRGNAVNYWNNVSEVTLYLPRPLSKSGVVLLRSKRNDGTNFVKVRPDVIRSALNWLIVNNPLYKNVTISEENLDELSKTDLDVNVPSITLTDEEATELENSCASEVRVPDVLDEDDPSSSQASRPQSNLAFESSISNSNNAMPPCNSSYIDESFELEADRTDDQTEAEKIARAVNTAAGKTIYATGELNRSEDLINEYTTKMLMQNCFPTLFPTGEGGLHPLVDDDGEHREHEYKLAEYCAHIMKWRDRRFVIHSNFKFFCLNLIQRRQIDGLVRRVGASPKKHNIDDPNLVQGCSDGIKNDISAAMEMLESLKPYFRGVRGSGLYWSNVRDDLMSMLGNRVLPSRWPTFFLTLSAADTVWPDFFRACNPALTLEQARHLSSKERRRYLNENPDIAARHFNRRFDAFFASILCGRVNPLGKSLITSGV